MGLSSFQVGSARCCLPTEHQGRVHNYLLTWQDSFLKQNFELCIDETKQKAAKSKEDSNPLLVASAAVSVMR